MTVILDTPEYQLIETVTPNGRTVQVAWKTGSSGANADDLYRKAAAAIQTNIEALALPDPTDANTTFLGHAPVGAGTLTTATLSGIVRLLTDQVDALTRQNNALVEQTRALTRQNTAVIRLALGLLDNTAGT